MNYIIAIGECLLDKVNDKAYLGGASFNFACYVGKYCKFLTCLSSDKYGIDFLNKLKEYEVDTSNVVIDTKSLTPYSEVKLDKNGERSFIFNFTDASFFNYKEEYVKESYFSKNDIFYFGSVFLLSNNGKKATLKCLEYAKKADSIIAFDVNYRDSLYPNKEDFKSLILPYLEYVNILKVSEDEYDLLFNDLSYKDIFFKFKNLTLIVITLGSKGGKVIKRNLQETFIEGKKVIVKDTIGCGDSFFATFLRNILGVKKEDLLTYNYKNSLKKAILVSSLVASIQGAILPLETIDKII